LESLAVASRPLQRLLAETDFYSNRDAILPHRKPLTMDE